VHSSGYTGPDRSITTLVSSTRWQNITALVPPSHRLSSDERLDRFILHYLRLDGARALRYLKHHPDSAYTAQGLWQALSGLCIDPLEEPAAEDEAEPGSTEALVESSIPVTDEHCLREIEREFGRLLRQREAARILRMEVAPLDTEISLLRKYIHASRFPDGRLRSFPGSSKRAYQSMSQALKRFRERVQALDPELSAHITAHLVTTPHFVWRNRSMI